MEMNEKNYVERENWHAVQLADMALKYLDEFDDLNDEIDAIRDLYNSAISLEIKDEFEIACHFLGVPLHRRTKAYGVTESQHVGEIGQRQQFDVTVTSIISLTSVRGTTNFHKFVDDNGNRLIWFASNAKLERGRRYSGWAIVKKHTVFRGIPETMLTRCAFEEVERTPVAQTCCVTSAGSR